MNICIVVVQTNPTYKKMSQEDFRWKIVEELVAEAKVQDSEARGEEAEVHTEVAPPSKTPLQIREEGRDGTHHHDIQPEYVSTSVAEKNQRVVDADPSARPTKRKKCRQRDHNRMDGKVLNPFNTSSSYCIVCKFFFKKPKATDQNHQVLSRVYDRSRVARDHPRQRLAKTIHPRLCSKKCFDIFHNTRTNRRTGKRRRKRTSSSTSHSTTDSYRVDV